MSVEVDEFTCSVGSHSVPAALAETAKGERPSIVGGLPTRSEDVPDRCRSRDRVQYVRLLDGNRWYAISEIDSNDDEQFSAQEDCCMQWRPFVPTGREREMVRKLREKGAGRHGWTEFVDLDAVIEELPVEHRAAVEELREFVHDHLAQLADLRFDGKRPDDLRLAREVGGHFEQGKNLIREVVRWFRRHRTLARTVKDRYDVQTPVRTSRRQRRG